jgi:hypothetical protein
LLPYGLLFCVNDVALPTNALYIDEVLQMIRLYILIRQFIEFWQIVSPRTFHCTLSQGRTHPVFS